MNRSRHRPGAENRGRRDKETRETERVKAEQRDHEKQRQSIKQQTNRDKAETNRDKADTADLKS
jgi:hypothetical protein